MIFLANITIAEHDHEAELSDGGKSLCVPYSAVLVGGVKRFSSLSLASLVAAIGFDL